MTEQHTASGTIEFVWDGDDTVLVTLEPDDPNLPHTFELAGELLERVAESLVEGARVEVDFVAIEHEIVDPDGGPSDGHRAEVSDVRIVQARP